MPRKHYDWDIGNAPPKIAKHSRAKHDVIRDYVTKYISVLTADPRIDTLPLTLVDGFAGGGLFTDSISGGEVFGSPLMLLNTVTAAEQIAQARRTKNFRIDARFVFVEAIS